MGREMVIFLLESDVDPNDTHQWLWHVSTLTATITIQMLYLKCDIINIYSYLPPTKILN